MRNETPCEAIQQISVKRFKEGQKIVHISIYKDSSEREDILEVFKKTLNIDRYVFLVGVRNVSKNESFPGLFKEVICAV